MSRPVFHCRLEDVPAPPHGLRFTLARAGVTMEGFLVRAGNDIRAYSNRCAHMELELDLEPGLFFCTDNRYLICSTHAALFEPRTGRCIDGPCAGRSLEPLLVTIDAGRVSVTRSRSVGGALDWQPNHPDDVI